MNCSPGDIETVHEYVIRNFEETGKFYVTITQLREHGGYWEVRTNGLTDEMETWLGENSLPDEFYYVSTASAFTPTRLYHQEPCWVFWFFDSKDTAALFKLAHGLN